MSTRNSDAHNMSMFQRRESVSGVSEADSDFQSYKEEFEKKEKEYRQKITTLKKEVSTAKESLSKIETEVIESRERANT